MVNIDVTVKVYIYPIPCIRDHSLDENIVVVVKGYDVACFEAGALEGDDQFSADERVVHGLPVNTQHRQKQHCHEDRDGCDYDQGIGRALDRLPEPLGI